MLKKIAIFFLCLCFPLYLFAVDPADKWFTLTTEHFHIHHTKEQTLFATALARHLEAALPRLSQDLSWPPPKAIDIVVDDSADDANGMAISIPFNYIQFYAVPFNTDTQLMEYEDWVKELATHELTHIVANDTSNDIFKVLRTIFGSISKPNILQPRWLTEGLAVYQESALTEGGRGKSAFTEGLFRVAVRNKKLLADDYFRIDRLNDGVFWWPAGSTPYLFGYAIQAGLEHDNNTTQSVPGKISVGNSARVPYTLNNNLKNIAHLDWEEAWKKTMPLLEKRYSTNKQNFSKICQLTNSGQFTGGASLSKDGWIYFTASHPQAEDTLARIAVNTPCLSESTINQPINGEEKPNYETLVKRQYGGASQVSVAPDDKTVAYAMTDLYKTYKMFSDLYLYHVDSKKVERLTEGARAWDPAFTPTGTDIVYIRNLGNNLQSLEVLNIATKTSKPIFTAKTFERLSSPFVSKSTIYFSLHNNRGQEEVLKLPFPIQTNAKPQPAIIYAKKGKRFFERHAYEAQDGSIYYSAHYQVNTKTEQDYEIFHYNPQTKTVERLTHTESGFSFFPKLMPTKNTILVSNLGLSGFNLATLPLEKQTGDNTTEYPSLQEALTGKTVHPIETPVQVSTSADKPYSVFSSPASTMWPQYWLPSFDIATDGALLGALTSANDPLQKHEYLVEVLYDTRAKFPHYFVRYTNHELYPYLILQAEQTNNYLQSKKISNRTSTYQLDISWPINHWQLGGGFAYEDNTYINEKIQNFLIFSQIFYQNTDKNALAMAAQHGLTWKQGFSFHPKQHNNEIQFVSFEPSLSTYFPGIFAADSTILQAALGISTNHNFASNYYIGGGLTTISNSDYVVRGYPLDALLGQRIGTVNFSYVFPFAHPYEGWFTYPLFFKNSGMRFAFDAGSANLISLYDKTEFLGYEQHTLGDVILTGAGLDFVLQGTILYYVPFEMSMGIHQGFRPEYGGETELAINFLLPSASSYLNKQRPVFSH